MIRIEALPASDGDCLWVEWTYQDRRHRMVIDGGHGPALARRLGQLPPADRAIDIVVCTHIDSDHIAGLVSLFADPLDGLRVDEVWFNGHRHLRPDLVGPRQGDRLEGLLDAMTVPWNTPFGGAAVVVPDLGPLPVIMRHGLTFTLLAPSWEGLARLDAAWPEVLAEEFAALQGGPPVSRPDGADPDAGVSFLDLASGSYVPDQSSANGSSIAFIAEHKDGGRVLFAADAPAEELLNGLRRLAPGEQIAVDLCKAPHHGSAHNVSADLVATLDCRHWLFSTSGARHGHPDRRAVARIVSGVRNPVLWFNYRSTTTEEYADDAAATRYGFQAIHPDIDRPGITLTVSAGRVEVVGPVADHRSCLRSSASDST